MQESVSTPPTRPSPALARALPVARLVALIFACTGLLVALIVAAATMPGR